MKELSLTKTKQTQEDKNRQKELIDSGVVPEHIAIIMDGNGRWAKNKNMPRNIGHEEGLKILSKITQKVFDAGVKSLTVYAFSSENWNRPKNEIKHLMALFEKAIESNFQYMIDNKIKFNLLGNIKKFPSSLQKKIESIIFILLQITDQKMSWFLLQKL